MIKFILASQSPRREKILTELGFAFNKAKHRFNEPRTTRMKPKQFVEFVAVQKAKSLAGKFKDSIIISADTIVVLKGEIIGKPDNPKHAKEILQKLSGTKHVVYTGLCLLYPRKKVLLRGTDTSTVTTRKLSAKEIDELSHKHLDKAGAYAVQESDDMFVKHIDGDYYNVVGFPVWLFARMLAKMVRKILAQ